MKSFFLKAGYSKFFGENISANIDTKTKNFCLKNLCIGLKLRKIQVIWKLMFQNKNIKMIKFCGTPIQVQFFRNFSVENQRRFFPSSPTSVVFLLISYLSHGKLTRFFRPSINTKDGQKILQKKIWQKHDFLILFARKPRGKSRYRV